MGKPLSKSDLISKLAEENDGKLSRKDVKGVLESLATIGYKELKKTGIFLVPGFAKFVVIKKPATKERKGINPFTKEPTVSRPSRPARSSAPARSRPPKTRSSPELDPPRVEVGTSFFVGRPRRVGVP